MPPAPPSAGPPPPPISRLAIAALVVAIAPGCPLVSLLGTILGMVALRRIVASGGRLGGRRLAAAAVIAGWLGMVVWSGVWWWLSDSLEGQLREAMRSQIDLALKAREPGELEQVAGLWPDTDPGAPRPAEVRAFGAELESRYGPFERVTVTAMDGSGTPMRMAYTMSILLFFERDQKVGSARFDILPGTLEPRLRRLEVNGAALGSRAAPGAKTGEAVGE